MSGSGTYICLSNLPGRSKALSRIPTLFVAANTITLLCVSNPRKECMVDGINSAQVNA